jgi:hypothetical protein
MEEIQTWFRIFKGTRSKYQIYRGTHIGFFNKKTHNERKREKTWKKFILGFVFLKAHIKFIEAPILDSLIKKPTMMFKFNNLFVTLIESVTILWFYNNLRFISFL